MYYAAKVLSLQTNTNSNIMETRKHIAVEKLDSGTHNCAQAIICTYANLIGIDEETGRNLGLILFHSFARHVLNTHIEDGGSGAVLLDVTIHIVTLREILSAYQS